MNLSRRKFLAVTSGSSVLLLSGCLRDTGPETIEPTVANYDGVRNNSLAEGQTLAVSFLFASPVDSLSGALPVQIEPDSSGGAPLMEPQPLFFYETKDQRVFHTILSAPLDVIEADYTTKLQGKRSLTDVSWDVNYQIRRGAYRETAITVDKDFTEPTPEIKSQMKRDFKTMWEIYRRRTPRRWSAPFIHPVITPDKDNFGDKRVYNEIKHSRHAGLDYKAPMGTVVSAMNDAEVVFSGEQWVPGETICLDHGGGIFSRYMHLSRREVREGDIVRRGDVIALTGKSGGQKPPPHLHLAVIANGVHVDPKSFMRTAAELLGLEAQDHLK